MIGVEMAESTHVFQTMTGVLKPRSRFGPRTALRGAEKVRLAAMALVIVGLLLVGGLLLVAASGHHYRVSKTEVFGVGTGILALTLGIRHAFDADHIAAIDNTTRKLMEDGRRPLGAGFFFSLGHSSVVFGLALLISLGVSAATGPVVDGSSALHHYTGLIGTSVSGAFLYLIAAVNIVILVGILRVFAAMRRGEYDEPLVDFLLDFVRFHVQSFILFIGSRFL